MRERLKMRLYEYILDNNPDLLVNLQSERQVSNYLYGKVRTVNALMVQLILEGVDKCMIEEQCFAVLIGDLLPSRYNYVLAILEEEFSEAYESRRVSGTLTYEVINIVETCASLFDELEFSPVNEDDRFVRYAVTGAVKDYLDKQ